jgi:hypothetical protein
MIFLRHVCGVPLSRYIFAFVTLPLRCRYPFTFQRFFFVFLLLPPPPSSLFFTCLRP